MANDIQIVNVSKSFSARGAPLPVLEHVSLTVAPGQFVSIVGPSGCGKTTLLKVLASFDTDYSGECLVGGARHARPSPERGFVFQKPALFPWYTVWDNITIGPRAAGKDASVWSASAKRLVSVMGLEGFEQTYPHQLSGGMAQRVQLARVLINEPEALLMDEPFGALDYLTRLRMQELVLRLHQQYSMTTVFITHDVDEAVLMSDRVAVLSARPGRLLADISIDLPKPRGVDVVESREYGFYKARILGLLGFQGASRVH